MRRRAPVPVLTEREETNSVAIASRRVVLRLNQDLHRPQVVRRIADWLNFGGNIIETGTTSYRLARPTTLDSSTTKANWWAPRHERPR